ncbi:DUF4040 family protein [Corynebacterium glutamicum]|uniref:DUF4040 family protein n=1 Tax=Corynebacterium glutamicum TaxID=1718 RepID=UPI00058A6046|nr:DUF4040 family protein [Corynebacterium glutamicum]AJE66332.1 monovalent cation/H+ antiporter subunit A [Corynebacterium glutamicum]OKX92047.1 cation:proton antiporter [Corynebacterium glutamicum]TWS33547.1 cation:proton antiporter [Corynebacterium glutamicum]
MSLLFVVALAVISVFLAPISVKVIDRKAGWPLAVIFAVAAYFLVREAGPILDGQALTWDITWVRDILGSGVDVKFALRADALSLFFALLALVIGAVVFVYSAEYLPRKKGNTSFYTIMTAFTAAILLLVLADDVFVLFVGWELVSLASFMLIARSGSSGESGSIRTLILTFFGGLTLLTAVAIAATQAGTTSLDGILHSDFWAEKPVLTGVIAVLIAMSAFTKSAQFPFHFWLPEAMAAATPVSAFLHAAAVVKAGIYLLLRFSIVFHDVAVWNWLLIIVGMGTAIMSAYFAVQKTDLKKLTAYSTVSHLGWIVATIGVGTPFALGAAIVHTLSHALFKSSLFMLIGVIDHQTGTRDIRRLGFLVKQMPFTFVSVSIGALSMASVPPLLGFVSKEGMITAFMDAPIGNSYVVLLLVGAAIGAVLTFTYSAKLVLGAFVDGPRDMSHVKEAPVSLWLPAALPGLMSLPLVLVLSLFDAPVSAAATSAAGEAAHMHLALWHGINTPLLISLGVLVAGILGVLFRKELWKIAETSPFPIATGNDILSMLVYRANLLGKFFGRMADSMSPRRHLVSLIVLLWALAAFATIHPSVQLAPKQPGIDRWIDLIPLAIIALSVFGLVTTQNRLSAAVLVGTVGVGVSFQMLLLGAPDVALTQFLVEGLVVVIIMMVVRHQPANFKRIKPSRRRSTVLVAVLAAFAAFMAVWGLLGRHERSELAMWYLNQGPEITSGANVVNTILVEFRALDTLGELSVLGMAAVVIGAMVASMPRHPFAKGTHPRPFGQSQLNSIPLRMLLKVLVPALCFLSFMVFMRGHNDPGGGFIAALIAGGALMFLYLSKAKDGRIFRPNVPFILTGAGILMAVFSGVLGLTHGSFLYAIHFNFAGQHWTTSMIFDLGVYLAVLGMVSMAINGLGGYLRPGTDIADLDYARRSGPLPATPTVEPEPEGDEDWPEPINPAGDNKEEANR